GGGERIKKWTRVGMVPAYHNTPSPIRRMSRKYSLNAPPFGLIQGLGVVSGIMTGGGFQNRGWGVKTDLEKQEED
ncbi:MAG: hypothetical protein JXD19_02870, partial [Deltaproteobacteria bacterium]|nr:hypothetical protein [Deltaproteobacteria bacterium]